MPGRDGRGPASGRHGMGLGGGWRLGSGGGGYGPTGDCICVRCGTRVPHPQGVSCTSIQCPACGMTMVREALYNDRKKR